MIKRLLKGELSKLSDIEITEEDDLEITDYPIGGITNTQMEEALKEELKGFYQEGSVYLCTDNGSYGIKTHLYKFTGEDWEDVTPEFNYIKQGETDPTENTEGTLGLFYLNKNTGRLFQCVSIVENAGVKTYEWELRVGSVIIELTGESGRLTAEQLKLINNENINVMLLLDGKIYRYVENQITFKTYTNVVYPTISTEEIKAIYVNISPEAVNYGTWSLEEIEVGGSISTDDVTIHKNSNEELEVIGITDGNETIDFSDIYQAITIRREV